MSRRGEAAAEAAPARAAGGDGGSDFLIPLRDEKTRGHVTAAGPGQSGASRRGRAAAAGQGCGTGMRDRDAGSDPLALRQRGLTGLVKLGRAARGLGP